MRIKDPIYGKKIFLKSLELVSPIDFVKYLSWLTNPLITRYLEVEGRDAPSIESIASYVKYLNDSENNILLGIFSNEDGLHIGNIKLGSIDFRHSRGDIGFLIGEKNFWGKGYASEAISLLAKYAHSSLMLHKITAGCYEENIASEKALIRAGFKLEAVLPGHLLYENRWTAKKIFGMILEESKI